MAGNPFRRPGAAAAPTGREAAADLSVDTSDTVTKPRKVVKKVRIQSPVISPDEPQEDPFEARLNDQGHSGSPPPVGRESDVATELRKSFIDSVAKGASNLNREAVGDVPPQSHGVGLGTETTARAAQQQLLYNPSQQQALHTPSQEQPLHTPAHQQTPSNPVQQQAPFNPFARTLASIEGGYGTTAQPAMEAKSVETTTNEEFGATVHVAGKSAMDVDSFTRMLLTGTPRLAANPQLASTPPIPVEGSSTEASSVSRQSMFESLQAPHPESPRSSYESSRSDDGADTNEHSSLVNDARPKKAKPPPPAHHRGKLLSKKGPQTVSFADFDTTHPAESGQQSPALPSPVLHQSARGRSASDLNKPLPPPPMSNSPDPSPNKIETEENNTLSVPPLQANNELQFQKIRPPPPPITRRSSTKKTDISSGRTRSSSNLSKSSIPEDFTDSPTSLEPPSSQLTVKPPPPPARRAANSVSSVERDNTVSHSIPEAPSQTSTSKAPPPPPSRQTLRGAPTLTRTPSTQSTSSIGHRRTSPSINQAPPPPPPRRGDKRSSFDGAHLGAGVRRPSNGSQRSSIELRRSSGTSTNDAQAPPMPSLQHVPEGEPGQDITMAEHEGGKNILADLSAFQAEIDALRAQIGK